MKTSTTSRIVSGALCGAAGGLLVAWPATASAQEKVNSTDQRIFFVDDADGNEKGSGIYTYSMLKQHGPGLYGVQFGEGGQDQDVDFTTRGGYGLSFNGQPGFYTTIQKGNAGEWVWRLDPRQQGQGVYTWAPGHDAGKSMYAWAPKLEGGQDGVAFFGPRVGMTGLNFSPDQEVDSGVQFWTEMQDDDVTSESVEVHINNDDISVKINGKEIPAHRIKREDGRIIILDENGDEVKKLNVFLGDGENPFGNFEMPEWRSFITEHNEFEPGLTPFAVQQESPRVMIGIHMDQPGAALRKHLRLGDDSGVMVIGVLRGLPADKAGVGVFDVIVSVDGAAATGSEVLRNAIGERDPGDTIELEVIQSGRKRTIQVEVDAYDAGHMSQAEVIGSVPDTQQFFLQGGQPFGNMEFDAGQWLLAPDGENIMRFQVPRDLAFDPDLNAWRELKPDVFFDAEGNQWRGFLDDGHDADEDEEADDADDAGDQLDRLDRRIEELERLLDQLIEQAKRGGGDR